MTEQCRKIRDAVALDGAAPTDTEARAHVADCAECRAFVDRVLAVESEIDALVDEDVSDEVVAKLLARPELQKPARTRPRMTFVAGLAAAVVIGAVAMSVTFRAQEQDTARRSRALEGVLSGGSGGDDVGVGVASEAEPERAQREANAPAEPAVDEEMLDSLRELGNAGSAELRDFSARMDEPMVEGRALETVVAESPPVARQAAPPASAAPKEEDVKPKSDDDLSFNFNAPLLQRPAPQKRVHVDPSFGEGQRGNRPAGVVVVELTVDREGNVVDARTVDSSPPLDEAVLEAVRQWKYVPADVDRPPFRVEVIVDGGRPRPDDAFDAHAFLMERSRIEGPIFQEPRGYWANTYLPGDPTVRRLEARLRAAGFDEAPHDEARPLPAGLDAPARGGLAVSMAADRRGLDGPARLLVEVGLKAALQHGRRRPPMNVALVLDTATTPSREMRALATELVAARELGDRFRLYAAGAGELVAPDAFRHGPVRVALDALTTGGDLAHAVELALRAVHAGDDPSAPLGTSLVLIATARTLGPALDGLRRLAHESAIGGVPVSAIGVGSGASPAELDALALDGQGRRYELAETVDAPTVIERELLASSRAVARAVRLRIKLADGVKLVDVIGSRPLDERQASRVREAEKSIDLRLARNLGIEADRGDDEDGIQIVIPSFYAGDEHTILLDVVAPGPGAIAEATARYKDLTELRNTVARAGLTLGRHRATEAAGPREIHVRKSFLAHHVAEALASSGDALADGHVEGAVATLRRSAALLEALGLASHEEVARDLAMLRHYDSLLASVTPRSLVYLADSLRVASAHKKHLSLTDT